jgi:hypothetical protein
VAASNELSLVDGRRHGQRGLRRECADADRGLSGKGDLSNQSRRGERQDELAKPEMRPPIAPIVKAPLERKMNWGGTIAGRLATAQGRGVLWRFDAPGNPVA